MINLRRVPVVLLASMICAVAAASEKSAAFDLQEIQAATTRLIAALEDPDPTAWVYMYTEDAVLLEAGSPPLEGRAKLLELAHAMQPMSAVTISVSRTERQGTLAYMYGRASWMNGRPPRAGSESKVHLAIIWRKEADGQWRVALESLVPEVAEQAGAGQ